MTFCNRTCGFGCAAAAVIAAVIVGVVAAFLQITGTITVTPVFLWVAFGIAIGYLGLALLAASTSNGVCPCSVQRAQLGGALGTVLLSGLLLAIGVTATSILSAVLVGILLFFFALLLTATACTVRCLSACED
ncbi:MAG: hypothetical protein IJC17_00805 [Clostridia bacterium]|nr:hypothetical protein [Clostridia bacterium]